MKMPENPDFGWLGWVGAFGDGFGGGGGRLFDDDEEEPAAAAPEPRGGIDGFFPPDAAGSPRAVAESLHALFKSLISQLFVE